MKKVMTAGAALLLTTTIATAGGLDRSGQPVGALFEDGTYVELSFGYVMPDVSGELDTASPAGIQGSGNIANDYSVAGGAFKRDMNDQISYALIFDQPYGADIAYSNTDPFYPLNGTDAEFRSTGISLLGRYKLNENISVHGGLRVVTIGADSLISVQTGDPASSFVHQASYANDTAFAGVIGAAYERPEIAMRVALTYTSAMDISHDTDFELTTGAGTTPGTGTTDYTIPQSVNLDFQTGIATDTLLFGSVRWVEWTATEINSPGYPANPLVSYDDDVFTYNLGVGRRFSDVFSGSISMGYEKANGGLASNLSPTDGNKSIALGGAYTLDNGVEVSGGVRYIMIGDATTTIGAEFADNTATAVGLKVAYTY